MCRWKALAIVSVLLSLWMPVEVWASKDKRDEDSYTIGGVLSGYESEKHFRETIEVSGTDDEEEFSSHQDIE